MKIQVFVIGFNRAFSVTFPSIAEKLIRPLREDSEAVRVSLVVSRSREVIANPHTGESIAGEWEVPDDLDAHDTLIFSQDFIDERVGDLAEWVHANLRERSELDVSVHRNLLRELTLLDISRDLISNEADWVVYTRADLFHLDRFDIASVIKPKALVAKKSATRIFLPTWGYQPNDLMAVMTPEEAHVYFGRISVVKDFITTNRVLQSESLLGDLYPEPAIRRTIKARAFRVRAGGQLLVPRFSGPRHKMLKKMVPAPILKPAAAFWHYILRRRPKR